MGKEEPQTAVSQRDPESGISDPSSRTPSLDTLTATGQPAAAGPHLEKSPIWLQKTARAIPSPIKRVSKAIVRWVKGPAPPRIWRIRPFFPKIQTAPLWLVNRFAPRRWQKLFLLMALWFVWLLIFITVLDRSQFASAIPGFGAPTRISCTDTFFQEKNECGLNGNDCRPFSNTSLAFRCQAHCLDTEQLNPHAVGTQSLIYQPLVVGGPTDPAKSVESAFYRGDSFICAAAIHAGYFGDSQGGCGVVDLVGTMSNFPAVDQNGVSSFGFDSNFPLSFRFRPGNTADCKDQRWPLLGVTVAITALLSIFTDSPAVFFWSIFCIVFWHCALVADPPTSSDYYTIVSDAAGSFLPAAFCAAIIYQYCVRRQLAGLKAQFEKTVLWLGPLYVGALNDYTFDKIPIQRLTGHDLAQQPGAIPALVIIVIVIFCIAVGQIWAIRREGRLPRYLAFYVFVGVCLGLLAAIPHMNLRIHHYILGLLLVPGTALQTRPSLVYQGLLVGLFINGIARWNFDPIIQTGAELIGDGQLGSALPVINQPMINNKTILFTWNTSFPQGADGLSILVNDVERFRGYMYDDNNNFTWTRKAPAGDPEYFRFGYMDGSTSLDYTNAGTWDANGTWSPMQPGPSKL